MLSYVKKILAPDERVIYAATLHWIVYVQGLVFVILGGLFATFAPRLSAFVLGENISQHLTKPLGLVAALIVLIGLVLLLGSYIRVASTELVVTNRRVIAKYGFISCATFELMNSRVTGVNFDQTVLARVLGYGTIIVRGAGGDFSPIDYISDPQVFHNQLTGALEHLQNS